MRGRPLKLGDGKRAAALYRQGLSGHDGAKALGVSVGTFYRYLEAEGEPRRKAGCRFGPRHDALLKCYIPLALGEVGRFMQNGGKAAREGEELAGEALLALVRAARRFNASIGTPFNAWAGTCIHRALVQYLKRRDFSPLPPDYDDGAEGFRQQERRIYRTLLVGAVDVLPPKELFVIRGLFWRGWTLRDCGERLGVSGETVRRVRDDALSRLGSALRRAWTACA